MNKSEAGKLGWLKSKAIHDVKYKERVDAYYQSPNKCKFCSSIIKYEDREKIFCNRSCAAKHNNQERVKYYRNCVVCSVRLKSGKKYCSISCQKLHDNQNLLKIWKETGQIPKSTLKKYLSETYGHKCSVCGISEWNNKPIVFDLEHKDGNYLNNSENNVCLICPNCHSQTNTYKGKNVGKGRHYRRERYKQGKSY